MIRARASRAAAHVMPLLMSVLLALATIGLLPYGGLVLLSALAWAGWSYTPAGERWTVQLLTMSRMPSLFQRHSLAPVARSLLEHQVPPVRNLLVCRRLGVGAQSYGASTVVIGTALVENVAAGRLPAREAAALIAHEIGVTRTGLTRSDPCLLVLLMPWQVWLAVVVGAWSALRTILHPILMRFCLVVAAGVQLWLAFTQDPRHLYGAALFVLGCLTYLLLRDWARRRALIGDVFLAQHGLGPAYSALLLRSFTDPFSRDRAIQLRYQPGRGPSWPAPANP